MFFTVEPMINLGGYGVKVLGVGWTAVTRDRSLSAQFEHSVGVTENGVEIFTKSPKGLDKPPYPYSILRLCRTGRCNIRIARISFRHHPVASRAQAPPSRITSAIASGCATGTLHEKAAPARCRTAS